MSIRTALQAWKRIAALLIATAIVLAAPYGIAVFAIQIANTFCFAIGSCPRLLYRTAVTDRWAGPRWHCGRSEP